MNPSRVRPLIKVATMIAASSLNGGLHFNINFVKLYVYIVIFEEIKVLKLNPY